CNEYDSCTHHIGKITPTGTITEYPLTHGEEVGPIAGGPDGNVWFVGSLLGKITPGGTISEYPLPAGDPVGITGGPDGNVWFADEVRNSISKVVLVPPRCIGDCNGDHSVTVGEILTMVNITLGTAACSDCADCPITVDQIIAALNNALNGCGG